MNILKKTSLLALLMLAGWSSQTIASRAARGAFIGGLAGAGLGGALGGGRGAGIGAAAGLATGAIAGAAADRRDYYDNGYVYTDGYDGNDYRYYDDGYPYDYYEYTVVQ